MAAHIMASRESKGTYIVPIHRATDIQLMMEFHVMMFLTLGMLAEIHTKNKPWDTLAAM